MTNGMMAMAVACWQAGFAQYAQNQPGGRLSAPGVAGW
jgi:hypothetical protein